jgi:hypothetical protein
MLPVGAALLSRRFLAVSTCLLAGAGLRVAHAAIAVRLTYEAQKVTDTELKILELGGAAKRLSKQLESTTPWLIFVFLLASLYCNCIYTFLFFLKGQGRARGILKSSTRDQERAQVVQEGPVRGRGVAREGCLGPR